MIELKINMVDAFTWITNSNIPFYLTAVVIGYAVGNIMILHRSSVRIPILGTMIPKEGTL